MASIARKNLFEDIPRFLVAQAGIMFAVSLVTIQLGILRGFTRSTARLVDQSSADLWVASKDMVHLELTSSLPVERVLQAQKVEGVEFAEALMIRSSIWRDASGKISPVRIFGFNPGSRIFAGWNLPQGELSALRQPYTVFVDQAGLRNLGLKNISEPGTIGNFGSLPAQIVGLTEDTQSIASSVFVFTSLETAHAYSTAGINTSVSCTRDPNGILSCDNNYDPQPLPTTSPSPAASPNTPGAAASVRANGSSPAPSVSPAPSASPSPSTSPDSSASSPAPTQSPVASNPVRANDRSPLPPPRLLNPADPISYVLIRAKPGQNIAELKQRLETALPDTRIYTQTEIADLTREYWTERTGVGFILGLGATVGFIVGMVIVGQILYSSVSDHLREFGTLKAMGASNWVIYRVILEQALWMAVLGYLPSIALCLGLGTWTQAAKGIMILISPATAGGVFILTVVMCVGSALFAVQKVTRVDPAIVFKA